MNFCSAALKVILGHMQPTGHRLDKLSLRCARYFLSTRDYAIAVEPPRNSLQMRPTIAFIRRRTEAHRAKAPSWAHPASEWEGWEAALLPLPFYAPAPAPPSSPPAQEALTLPVCTNSPLLQREDPGSQAFPQRDLRQNKGAQNVPLLLGGSHPVTQQNRDES